MRYIADLHLHSKYSRACSKDLDLEHNEIWAKKKGIGIVGTGDFTHPVWFRELKEKLIEEKPGLFKVRGTDGKVLFMLTTEISCIYSQGGKVRRIHLCLFAPDLASVGKINQALIARGVNLKSDGRPIMGLHADEVVKIVLEANPENMVIPAHAWTPWFSVFGSNSGFDSLAECFGEMTKHIHSIETGLSSDPLMNWRLSALDNITLISNSDAHSPANLGREANVFEIDPDQLSYFEIKKIIEQKDKSRFLYTIEFFPEEGKYHHDGHRACGVNFAPAESKKHGGLCPKCKKPLTIGVLNRVDALADREVGQASDVIPFKSIVPLPEIIAEVLGVGKTSKKVSVMYEELVGKFSEFEILLDLDYPTLATIAVPELVVAIKNVREQKVEPVAGYDGEYGIIKTLKPGQVNKPLQKALF
ncbi:MAG: DNA helicase UvrD [Candidatus Buchananbacteria bacterium]|nr:DNA helicase UvrD [Candidatus Buchananbacteria bacterium]